MENSFEIILVVLPDALLYCCVNETLTCGTRQEEKTTPLHVSKKQTETKVNDYPSESPQTFHWNDKLI